MSEAKKFNWRKCSTVIVACLAQAIMVWIGSLFIVVVLGALLGDKNNFTWLALTYVLFGLTGTGFAMLAIAIDPNGIESGRWIWVPPAALLIFGITWDVSIGHHQAFSDAFMGLGEGGLVRVFITSPTLACLCYSLIMSNKFKRDGHRSPPAI